MKIKMIVLVLFTSFLWAQKTLIPYRKGSLWGLCDKKSNMVLNPVFDSIKDMDYVQLFRVHKNGNEGVAYQGKIVIAPSATYTYYDLESTFIIEQDKKDSQSGYTAVYNLNGDKLINTPVYTVNITPTVKPNDPIVVVVGGKNKNSGVFVYDKSKQKIVQWLYKDKNAYFSCKFKTTDNAIHIYFHDEKTDKSFYYKANYNNKLQKYDVAPDKQAQIEDMNSNQDVVEQREDKYGFYEVKNNYAERIYAFATKKGKTRLLRTDRRNRESKFKHDSIFFDIPEADLKIHKFMQGNGYELSQYDTSPNNETDKEKVDTIFTYYNYLTYKKNNKLGLILGTKVWEAKYDSIRYFRAESELKPYFLVSIKNEQGNAKWGVIASENQIILPCVYDEITVNFKGGYGTLWAIKQNGRYGIANNRGEILKEPQYDNVFPKELFYAMHIVQNNKFGWYSHDNVFHEPIFPYKIYFEQIINKERFLKLVDEKGKLKGYANFDGTLYFKD
jgi:hypothetical protein